MNLELSYNPEINIYRTQKDYMNIKSCNVCKIQKSLEEFEPRYNRCKQCHKTIRNERNKKSICRHCKSLFRPGTKGRFRFCCDECRLLNKIKINNDTKCWEWQGRKNEKGYGYFYVKTLKDRTGLAHRCSYLLFKKTIDHNLCVLHKCDNASCVNPDHLYQGTQIDNINDQTLKGRNFLKASKRLKREDVIRLRDLFNKGVTRKELVKIFDVKYECILKITSGKSWKNV